MARMNKQWLLARRPRGSVQLSDFELVERPVPELEEGQLLLQNHYLSLDPYMRGRMDETKSYAASQELGQPMIGGTVGEVVESRNSAFARGSLAVAMGGWQQFTVSDGRGLMPVARVKRRLKLRSGRPDCSTIWLTGDSRA